MNEANEIKKYIDSKQRVILHALPGMGKTYYSLKMSNLYKVCVHFDCEVDFPYFEDMLNAYRDGIQTFMELLITFCDVNPQFEESILFIFENIECSEIFYNDLFPIFKELDYKMLMSMNVKNKSLSKVIADSFIYTIRPISFKDFFSGSEGEWPEEIISGHLSMGKEVPYLIHRNCMRLMEDYLVTGGIPEAYNVYSVSDNPEEDVKSIHEKYKYYVLEKLLEHSDISEASKLRCRQIVDSLADQMLEGSYSRFMLGKIRDGITISQYDEALNFLVDNHFLIKICQENKPGQFKLFFYDCGMAFDILLQRSNKKKIRRDFASVSSIIYQNFLAQETVKAGLDASYWKSMYTAVVDAVINLNGKQLAFKLFNQNDLRGRSLDEFSKSHPNAYLIKLSGENLGQNGKYFLLPVYAISCMANSNFRKLFLNVVERLNE